MSAAFDREAAIRVAEANLDVPVPVAAGNVNAMPAAELIVTMRPA